MPHRMYPCLKDLVTLDRHRRPVLCRYPQWLIQLAMMMMVMVAMAMTMDTRPDHSDETPL